VPVKRATVTQRKVRSHVNPMRKSVRWSPGTRHGISLWRQHRRRRPPDTSASRIKYPGSRDIVAVKKTWAIFQRNKLPESFGRASNESSRLSDAERDSLLVSPLPFESPRQPWGPRHSGVATLHLYRSKRGKLHVRSKFHERAARWNRKLDPKEETSLREKSVERW